MKTDPGASRTGPQFPNAEAVRPGETRRIESQ